MKHFLALSILMISFQCLSQDWSLLNPSYKYNYRTLNSNFNSSTVWVDSTYSSGENSIFILNRIVVDCDTCPPFYNGYPQIAYYDYPQFLQRKVIKSDSLYFFNSPQSFIIRHKASLNERWLFDTLNNITAEVGSIESVEVFSQKDSIKIIGLSSNDTIILSKNNGIIRFDPIYEDSSFFLSGINREIGESVPDFFDFYNFSEGDIFEYQGDYWGVGMRATRFFIDKVYINSKSQVGDTIQYAVSIHKYTRDRDIPEYLWHSPEYASAKTYSTTWKFINNPVHPTNCFNNQLIEIKNYTEDICSYSYNYTKLIASKDSSDLYTKAVGSLESYDFFKIQDTANKIMYRIFDLCDEHEVIYKVGLGEVLNEIRGFEWSSFRQLTAYKKGSDTIGVLTEDYKLTLGINTIEEKVINVYPNPAKDILYISTPDNMSITNISIIGLDGHIHRTGIRSSKINVTLMKPGIYILMIEFNNDVIYKKIIIPASRP